MPSAAARPVKQLSGGCAVLFGLPFLVAGLVIGWYLYLPMVQPWWSARHWEEVPCWIESAKLQASTGSETTTYKTEARYRYEFKGRTYHGTQVSLNDGGSDNIGDFQQSAYAQIRAHEGQERPFRCYVDPAQPQQAVLFRDLRWGLLLMLSLFPTLFPLAGALVTGFGAARAREARRRARLAEQHPEEPWLWRQEWAGDLIHAKKGGWMVPLAIAGWILLVQGPLAAAIIVSGELASFPLAALALLPAALALIPLFLLWRQVQTQLRLGRPVLWLQETPITPGQVLEGELRFDRPLSPLTTLQVRVLCQRHTTTQRGRSTVVSKKTVWEHIEKLPAAEARREANGVALPLRIEIPRGLPCPVVEEAAFVLDDDDRHVWSLEASSSSGGAPVTLVLPVFIHAEDVEGAEMDDDDEPGSTEQIHDRLKARGVITEFNGDGVPSFIDCPAGRFRVMGIFLLVFGCVWFGAFVIMLLCSAPALFLLIWGISAPLILAGGLWTMLHRRRVEIAADEMRVLTTVGPLYSSRQSYEPRHFVGFAHDSNLQSNDQSYYRVRGETTFGKKITLIDGITEAGTAKMLAQRLEQWRSGEAPKKKHKSRL